MFYQKKSYMLWILSIGLTLSCYASTSAVTELARNSEFYFSKLVNNISPADAAPGAVIAAQSKINPDYYYHWVRDAALAMDAMTGVYRTSESTIQRKFIQEKFRDYLNFTALIQNHKTLADLGEPKFNVDGSVFNEPWGRPQNDSPALRAISLIHWAKILIDENRIYYVREKMYSNELPATLPIKKDLEYVSHHWKDSTFDLWEEVKGTHFYTLMVSRRALLEGAQLANKLGDNGAANWYKLQANEIALELQKF